MLDDCLFCRIITRKIPADIVYEDEHTLAFLDIHPINKGHVLVIPKEHAPNMPAMSTTSWAHTADIIHILTPKLQAALKADGMNVGINIGEAAGQLVFHSHIHLIPRYFGDGHTHWHGEGYQEGEQRTISERIAKHLTQ